MPDLAKQASITTSPTRDLFEYNDGSGIGPDSLELEAMETSQIEMMEGYIQNAAGTPKYPFDNEPRLDLDDVEGFHFPGVLIPHPALDEEEYLAAGIVNSDGHEADRPTSDAEAAARIDAILAEDERKHINQNTLLFEYGPFAHIEKQLRDITDGIADERISHLVTAHVRQALHDAVAPNELLRGDPNTQEVLEARIGSLKRLQENIEKEVEPLLDQLENEKVDGMGTLREGLKEVVITQTMLHENKTKLLANPTLGLLAFNALRRVMTPSYKGLVGDARAHRNKQLTKSLGEMFIAAAELKSNAGNAEWEHGQGKATAAELARLSQRMVGLTKGVEDQVDSLALRKGMKDVNGLLKEASDAAADPDHKSSLEKISQGITDFVKKLTEALGKLFDRVTTRTPSQRET